MAGYQWLPCPEERHARARDRDFTPHTGRLALGRHADHAGCGCQPSRGPRPRRRRHPRGGRLLHPAGRRAGGGGRRVAAVRSPRAWGERRPHGGDDADGPPKRHRGGSGQGAGGNRCVRPASAGHELRRRPRGLLRGEAPGRAVAAGATESAARLQEPLRRPEALLAQ